MKTLYKIFFDDGQVFFIRTSDVSAAVRWAEEKTGLKAAAWTVVNNLPSWVVVDKELP